MGNDSSASSAAAGRAELFIDVRAGKSAVLLYPGAEADPKHRQKLSLLQQAPEALPNRAVPCGCPEQPHNLRSLLSAYRHHLFCLFVYLSVWSRVNFLP